MRVSWLALAVPFLAGAATSEMPARQPADDIDARCEALIGMEITPGTTIVAASHVPPSEGGSAPQAGAPPLPPLPGHCLAEGMIDPHQGADGTQYGIGFALALPDDWNGRFLLQGGGGMNGVVQPPIGPVAAGSNPALARGFAVLSHDSGHKGAVFDASFTRNQRAALDFAERAVRKAAERGKPITAHYYGREINHSYMTGCSTGGREGMLAMQRYPELFDGIVIGAPAMRPGFSNFGVEWAAVQFNQAAPRDADGLPIVSQIFSAADRETILKGMLDQCDALDGRADGMIMNVAQCNFQPARLQCTASKTDSCLSSPQVQALERAFAGAKDAAGYPAYTQIPYDTGIVNTDGPIPGYLPNGAPGVFGPASRALSVDVDARLQQLRADGNARLTDTHVWTNLSTFLGRQGKVMFFHGVSDPWFSAFDTWNYWQRAAEANGDAFTEASRFYMVPGMMHCAGGNAFDNFDLLAPLVDWVEKGVAPASIDAGREDSPARRPMCPHPAYAHFEGGDPDSAESYSCRQPAEINTPAPS
ncbi:feruloyl esterase [Altererythrobacter atlanticus]|uniref:Tannase and feruloyl esterase n=1 Tax=Croceibacterium atlanticum TaxID=1267766 RepID=A0A0F7KQR9_9SPHN|nr:tannase/feruloyl esterase family alpha/beta hydrolase [Croceibacterium atlanticum]AKH41522.1 Tannase and feruloyl esterase [Croceibacterium atlanticum]MBB5732984.1 feruloyl esterase [Croceibacterium atlanticum]